VIYMRSLPFGGTWGVHESLCGCVLERKQQSVLGSILKGMLWSVSRAY
jgi:hypothetical protein